MPAIVSVEPAGNTGVWSGKYTMPSEPVAAFLARTAGKPAVYLVSGGEKKVPPGFRKVGEYGKYDLYKRE
jgi:hypothetical protein